MPTTERIYSARRWLGAAVVLAIIGCLVLPRLAAEASHTDNSLTTPDPTMFTGEHAALTLDPSGFPVVAYFDLPGFDLRVLHCDDVNCADDESANVSIPDPGPASTGQYSDITSPRRAALRRSRLLRRRERQHRDA
jgi:hypothetical protein